MTLVQSGDEVLDYKALQLSTFPLVRLTLHFGGDHSFEDFEFLYSKNTEFS